MSSMQHSLTLQTDAPLVPPRLDEPAPYFEGRSTQGPVKLSDYAGRWLVLFAHPADFTPICASSSHSRGTASNSRRSTAVCSGSRWTVSTRISPGARASATASV